MHGHLEQVAFVLLRFIFDSKNSGFSRCLRMKDVRMDQLGREGH